MLGSAGYVKNHFADPVDMKLKPEHAKMAAYFNHDNGGGKLRGVYARTTPTWTCTTASSPATCSRPPL